MQKIADLYISLLPVLFAGVINSVFVKSKLLSFLDKPIDGGRVFLDGRRLFGDSKTYKGFLGYIIITILFAVFWGLVCGVVVNLESKNFFYYSFVNSPINNFMIGFLLGLAWAIFELPNSFIKRRLDIKPSKGGEGFLGVLFVIIDQADSIFGVMLVLAMFYPLTISSYFLYVAIGAATHILVNFLLNVFKIRKRPV